MTTTPLDPYLCTYKAALGGRQIVFQAATLVQAVDHAREALKATSKAKRGLVAVWLVETPTGGRVGLFNSNVDFG